MQEVTFVSLILDLSKFKLWPNRWLEEATDVTEEDKIALYKGLEDGIRHLHGLGLAHNDISPNNIMMDSENKPIIIDFDSAKPIGEQLVKGGTMIWLLGEGNG